MNQGKKSCLVVADTNGRIYGVFANEQLATQHQKDAERALNQMVGLKDILSHLQTAPW